MTPPSYDRAVARVGRRRMLTPPSDVRDLAKVDGAQSIDPTEPCPSCGSGGEGKSIALFGPNDTGRLSSSSEELPVR